MVPGKVALMSMQCEGLGGLVEGFNSGNNELSMSSRAS